MWSNYGLLPIDNYDLRKLNSYEKCGITYLGAGYEELEYFFSKLIPLFGDSEMYEDSDNLPFRLFNIDKRADRPSSDNILRNMGFRSSQSIKEWFDKWLTIFKMLDGNSLGSNDLDNKLREIIINQENNFMGDSFDFDTNPTEFTHNDLLLAQRIKRVLVDLLGRFTFEKLYTGGIFPYKGHISFIRLPWYNLNKILKNRAFSLSFSYKLPGWTPSTIAGEKGPLDLRRKFLLDTYLSSGRFALPTIDTADSSLSILTYQEVSIDYWAPHLMTPLDLELMEDFYYVASEFSYSIFEQYNKPQSSDSLEARNSFFLRLLKICKDKFNYDNNKIGIAYKGLMAKIFTEDDSRAWEFRKSVFNWLSSRGSYTLELYYEYGKSQFERITLTSDDFNYFFRDDYGFLASGFEQVQSTRKDIDDTIEKLRNMQDFIVETLGFIRELAGEAGEKIVIYTFNVYENGYGIDRAAMNYLPNSIPDIELEWKPPGSTKYRDIAFIYDPNDPNSIREFEEQTPIFLANLIVKPSAFVVRIPGRAMNGDECWFGFTPWGSLLPSQIVGHYTPSKPSYFGPPRDGMIWSDGTEEEYKNWYVYNKWNEIVNTYKIYGIHYYSNPDDFYNLYGLIGY